MLTNSQQKRGLERRVHGLIHMPARDQRGDLIHTASRARRKPTALDT